VLVLRSSTVVETEAIGAALAAVLRAGDIVILSGELGAGKTACARGMGRTLGADDAVTSPTFLIMRQHELASGGLLLHLDAYRLSGPDDVEELGLFELLDRGAMAVIEWGERVVAALGNDHLSVRFRHDDSDDDVRVIEVEPTGTRWQQVQPELDAVLAPWTTC
jgi:tRNA threonylcarbamoyladenosine biosynthesis protein TsaE